MRRQRLDFERLLGLIDLFELGVDVGFADVKHTAFSVCAFCLLYTSDAADE